MSIEQTFIQWYQQLSTTDQQSLHSFIVQSFCSSSSSRSSKISFGGRQVGPVGASASNPIRVECPYCHNQIEIS